MKILLAMILSSFVYAGGHVNVATSTVVDIKKYTGMWYAISSLPQRFSKSCIAQTAEYEIISEGKVSVKNTCLRKNKKPRTIFGSATVSNKITNSELIVRFNTWWARLFNLKGDYNIVKIDPNYEYVIVGGQDRKSLWIMSRRPTMSEDVYSEYVNYAKSLGFNTNKLVLSKF